METNPKEYHTRPQSGGRQQQARLQPKALPQNRVGQQPKKAPAKMPKARVLAMADKLKKGLVIASIMGFGMFGGLATLHQVSTTASATTNKPSSTSTQTSSSQNSSNFLKQSGTTTATKTTTSTATPTPTSTATATTAPVTGSSTS